MRIRAIYGLALGALILAIAACSDGNSDVGQVNLQLATRGPASTVERRTRPVRW